MISVVGVFASRTSAEQAAEQLLAVGLKRDQLNLLTPDSDEHNLAEVPVADMEERGVGEALGGVIGGAMGAAGGLSLGAAAASLFIPGVGPVMAIGIAAAALLGTGGAVGGAKIGEALEDASSNGVPHDDLFVYEDALRHGRSVLVAFVETDEQRKVVRDIMDKSGAESLDAARDDWWLGLRDTEEEEYVRAGKDFKTCESSYRCGYEAAHHPFARGKSYNQAAEELKKRYPNDYEKDAFRDGYNRGKYTQEKRLEEFMQAQ